jgi:hypothetical protein
MLGGNPYFNSVDPVVFEAGKLISLVEVNSF